MASPPPSDQPENAAAAAAAAADDQAADPPVQAPEASPDSLSILEDTGAAEQIEKHNKYMTLYSRRLKGKYFSKKVFNGAANIFDHETTIDDETIKSSRWPCTRLFADPIPKLENRNISLPAESSAIPNNKESPKASC
ncbi:uncharacterized protein LOC120283547 [Dioscorea cayenensis subsp. rotundata]|uniref:Uncharacterized protein LOC120283547 n=1 Tax=Dioscorea cayennensis subsp. rotundata TaxID=55577 RepID=A0AB40D1S9_DIOCR|nr:uncharacterized protein LOC120283547 [Dioscorea cayenensis subsp. rotundata]